MENMANSDKNAKRAVGAELFWCDQLRRTPVDDPAYPVLKRLAESAGNEAAKAQGRV